MRADLRFPLLAGLILAVLGFAPSARAGLSLPASEESTLGNGLHLQWVRHPTVPMVSIEVWIAAGGVEDPVGQEGLAALTVSALRKGAGDRDAQTFADELDFLGARFSTDVDPDRARIALDLQARDLRTGLQLLADALLRPRFDADEVTRLRDQMAEGVVQAKENPRNVLGTYSRAHLFDGHPYGRPVNGTETSLPGLDVEDVRDFHRQHYGADRTWITLAGDIDPTVARRWVEELFGSMPRARAPRTPVPDVPAPTPGVWLIDKTDTPQTWFTIGQLGPSWEDLDDEAATTLVQTVLGGRFTSWLNRALRIEAGLTYGAGYRMQRLGHGGSAWISTFTATETTREAIDLALAQLDRLHERGLSEDDLASAKAYVKGQRPYDYETAADLATTFTRLAFYGIDRRHLDALFERIDAVDLDDCRAAIQRHFARDGLVFTAIGVADEIRDWMAAYGPVRERSNDDPGFSMETPVEGRK